VRGAVLNRLTQSAVAAGLALALWATAGTGIARASPLTGAGALTLTGTQKLDARLSDLTFTTAALSVPTHVRVLIPAGYATSTRRYPVLYLLHGCCDDWRSWTTKGDAEALTAGLPLIVVMPNGGQGGFYSDWYNDGAGGPPMYETYDIGELIPWVDAHYRTIAARRGRAVAGLSMGGYGAIEYAARHPDVFTAAASFSGAVDNMDGQYGAADAAFPTLDGGAPNAVWGPQATEEVRWRGHNPVDLARNLRGLSLTIRTGNGLPGGPYNQTSAPDGLEIAVHHESGILEQTLTGLGIPSVYQDYGPGSHSWPYWSRDLKLTLPTLMTTFAHPPAIPAKVTYTSIEPSYSVYGWSVAVKRSVVEFSTLSGASKAGFTLSGSGTATVLTPPDYAAGRTYRVTTTSEARSAQSSVVAAPDRRLTLPVALGPSNTDQEFTPQAQATGTTLQHATVTIVAPPARHRARRRHRRPKG
jgi:S-formylglutathione hydrolase FrmB